MCLRCIPPEHAIATHNMKLFVTKPDATQGPEAILQRCPECILGPWPRTSKDAARIPKTVPSAFGLGLGSDWRLGSALPPELIFFVVCSALIATAVPRPGRTASCTAAIFSPFLDPLEFLLPVSGPTCGTLPEVGRLPRLATSGTSQLSHSLSWRRHRPRWSGQLWPGCLRR